MFPRHISFHILYFRISFVSGYPSAPAYMYSCNPLNQGLYHITTHTPPLIASAPLLLVIAFVTSTPESDCQCSFCYYRLPQLPRVNANVSNNRMHVTYHEPGRFRWMLKVQRGKGNVPVWIMWTFKNHVKSCVTETSPNAHFNPRHHHWQQVYNLIYLGTAHRIVFLGRQDVHSILLERLD